MVYNTGERCYHKADYSLKAAWSDFIRKFMYAFKAARSDFSL